MRDLLVIYICKIIYWVLRKMGRHGAALPGLIAERLRPSLLRKLTTLPEGIIVVSGTNGKTTTTHLLSEVLRRSGKKVFTNHSGSNMTRGLLASIVRFTTLTGKLPFDVAVLEVDEAYAAKLAPLLSPRAAIVTNVLRDQLDRFGEIDYTAQLLFTLSEQVTECVVYNACDSRLSKVGGMKLSAQAVSFGFDKKLQSHYPDDDSLYGAGYTATKADFTLKSVADGYITVKNSAGTVSMDVSRLAGWHNALNLTAVYALVKSVFNNVDDSVFNVLEPPYGRGESLVFDGKRLVLQLVKNPGGFRIAMDVEPELPALIIINDAIADGRDVSWLWDVDVAPLGKRKSIFCSGTRAYDMTVRLKYNEIKVADTTTNIYDSIQKFIQNNSEGVVFLTYTSMMETRRILNKKMRAKRT